MSQQDFDRAAKVCGEFLNGNWTNRDAIETQVLSGGYVNILVLCSLKPEFCDKDSLPHKAIVRFLTGKNIFARQSEALQAVTFSKWGQAGIGPRLLGAFEGGRVEEFVEGHRITYKELRDPVMLMITARSLARLHSLDNLPLPIHPKHEDFMIDVLAETDKQVRSHESYLNVDKIRPDIANKVHRIFAEDYLGEFTFVLKNIHRIPHRQVTMVHGDHYMNNIIVREHSNGKKLDEFDFLSVDVEMGCHFYRGVDIGILLNEAMFDYSSTAKPTFVGHLDKQLWKVFIDAYIEKWKELNPTKFDPKIDNFETIYLESKFTAVYPPLFFMIYLMRGFVADPMNFPESMLDYMLERRQADVKILEEFKTHLSNLK